MIHPHAMISLGPATKDELLLCYDSKLNDNDYFAVVVSTRMLYTICQPAC